MREDVFASTIRSLNINLPCFKEYGGDEFPSSANLAMIAESLGSACTSDRTTRASINDETVIESMS